jgi:hypothetical protein
MGIVAAAVLSVLSFGSWAYSSAVGSAPDDNYHLTSLWCTSFQGDTCEVDPEGKGVYVPAALLEGIDCFSQNPNQSAGCQPFLDGTDPRPDVAFGHNNPSRNLYPDGFYQFANLFKVDSIQATALNVRFVNLGIFIAVGIGLFFALPTRLRIGWIWMWALGLVPVGMFVIASSNPSAWGIIGVAAGFMSLLGYLETRGPRTWVLGLFYLAMAILTVSARIDAVLYLGLGSLVAVWLSKTRGKDLLKKIWVGFVGLAFVVVQLIINPANLARAIRGIGQRSDTYENPLPWVQSQEVIDGSAFDWSLLWNNVLNVPGLWLGIFGGFPWGSLGWMDTTIPQIVIVGTMTVLVGTIFLAVRSADRTKVIALLVVLGSLWFVPVYLLQLGGFQAGEEVQPRYLLPLMMVFLGVVALTPSGMPVISDRGRVWFAVSALTIANAVALHTNIRRYTTGVRVQGLNLDSPREWWWMFFPDFLGPTLLWAIGSLAFGALLWFTLLHVVPRVQGVLEAQLRHEEVAQAQALAQAQVEAEAQAQTEAPATTT